MERKIGEIFEYNGEWYQCIVGNGCKNCAFYEIKCYNDNNDPIGDCCALRRKDQNEVIFKKLEKVGEPFTSVGKLYQHYKVFDIDNVYGDVFWCVHNYKAKTLTIEIKQTKEDMEEKKLNLKPFDIQKAREGKPVCTRDGRKARIICFDRRLFYKNVSYPILAVVERSDGEDDVCGYNEKGKVLIEDGAEYKDDLMMLPERKEGWINIYNADTTFYYADGRVFETKDEAVQEAKEEVEKEQREKNEYIDTIRVEWEE